MTAKKIPIPPELRKMILPAAGYIRKGNYIHKCKHEWKFIHAWTYCTPQYAEYRCSICGLTEERDK